MKLTRQQWFAILGIVFVTAVVELWFGRLWLGPSGVFGLYSTDVWSSEQSQRLFDPYSFSHFIHGILFFALLWPLRNKVSLSNRFVLAILLEAAWEVLENSPIIINRYREVTIALGYVGDSIVNSLTDIALAAAGFYFAHKQKLWVSIVVIIVCEFFTLWWVRDNLTLNIIMLTYPIDAIREWQTPPGLMKP